MYPMIFTLFLSNDKYIEYIPILMCVFVREHVCLNHVFPKVRDNLNNG